MRPLLGRNRRDTRAIKSNFVNGPQAKYPRTSRRDSVDRNYNHRSFSNSSTGGQESQRSRSRSSNFSRDQQEEKEVHRSGQKCTESVQEEKEVHRSAQKCTESVQEEREVYSPVDQSQLSSSSFLVCVVCNTTPSSPPLYGCESSHIICSTCRIVGGSLLSCPKCGSSDLLHRLQVAEELLKAELDENKLVLCPYKSVGCHKITRTSQMGEHRASCLFRPVSCPKGLVSISCTYIGPLYTIQQHARDEHNLHQGITVLEPGLIASKMFDKSSNKSCCDDSTNARFQPLELTYGDHLFYCYFERVAKRGLWWFFVRMFDREEQSKKFKAVIMIGHSGLERNEHQKAGIRFTGPVAHYMMRKAEVKEQGLSLTVSDEYLKSCKMDNVLFRIWIQVLER